MANKPDEAKIWTLVGEVVDGNGRTNIEDDDILTEYVREGWKIIDVSIVAPTHPKIHRVIRVVTLFHSGGDESED